jgi:predicted O-linked N-acetylglucosamine transferase (SPINDLY family)
MAQFNLGVILSNINDDVGAEAAYRAAIAQKPTFIEGILNLGTLLERLRRPEEALSVWRTILTFIDPSVPADSAFYVQTLNNLGRLLEIQKQLPEAEALLARSLKHDRKQPDVITHWVHLRQKLCEWPVYSNALGIPMKDMISGTSSLAMLSASDDPAAQLKTARRYVDKKVLKDVSYLSSKQSYGHERLRIGYLSSDFCSHAVSILTAELYGLHDRSKFEVYGFCWSNDDASPLRARVISGMDHHIKIGGLSDEDAAHLIHSHEIDILVDLHGLTLGTRHNILSYRPAPVQMTWLGFPGPTAIPEIDYVLCDAFVFPPELEPFFTEKPLRLPNVFQVNDRQRLIGVCPTKESCGLPENVFVFCCFNNTYKITPEVFGAWMRILKRVPNSLLWLVADNETVQKNLFKQAKKHGIAHNRLRFAERALPAAYLARFQVADLFLDTFPFGGGTTASDALWAGLPFLTYTGRTFASRMAGSLLKAVDLPELITYNLKNYEDKAVELAKHPERIAAMKQQLVDNRMNCALFDTPRFVRDLEQVFEQVVYQSSQVEMGIGLMKTVLSKFSIIIATHDRPTLLNRAIRSIKEQSYHCHQIIVVSDLNCPETYQVASKTLQAGDLFVQRLGDPGPSASRNLGMNLVTGDYFIFLDDDDTFRSDFLENLVNQLQDCLSKDQVYYTNCEVVHEKFNGEEICITETQVIDIEGYDSSMVYVKNFIPNNCLVFPRRLAIEITFDAQIAYEDWDFILSACASAELKHLPIFGPRIHKNADEDSLQRGKTNEAGLLECYIKIYSKHPPLNSSVAMQRQEIFSSIDLDIDMLVHNSLLS